MNWTQRDLRNALTRGAVVFGTATALGALPPLRDLLHGPACALTADCAASLGRTMGVWTERYGDMLVSRFRPFHVIRECTGWTALVVTVTALSIAPLSWGARCRGAVILAGLILAVNQIRLVSLVAAGNVSHAMGETLDHLVWAVLNPALVAGGLLCLIRLPTAASPVDSDAFRAGVTAPSTGEA